MGILLASGLARGTADPNPDSGDSVADANRPNPPRPIAEPSELFRVSTIQLGLVLFRRLRAAAKDRVSRVLGRG
jgi:hypothetical protein